MNIKEFKLYYSDAPKMSEAQVRAQNESCMRTLHELIASNDSPQNEAYVLYDAQHLVVTLGVWFTEEAEIERYDPNSYFNKLRGLKDGREVYADKILDLLSRKPQGPILEGVAVLIPENPSLN